MFRAHLKPGKANLSHLVDVLNACLASGYLQLMKRFQVIGILEALVKLIILEALVKHKDSLPMLLPSTCYSHLPYFLKHHVPGL